jgi:hypothetical protein
MVNAKITGFGKAYAVAVIFNALLLMVKESSPAVLDFMKALGHHWVTHGAFVLIVFVGMGMYFSSTGKEMDGGKLGKLVGGSTILGGLLIMGWFIVVG